MKKAEIFIGANTRTFTAAKGRGVCALAFPKAPQVDPITARYAYDASRTEAEAMILLVALESMRRGLEGEFEVMVRTEHRQLETALALWLPRWRQTGWVNSKGQAVAGWWAWLGELTDRYPTSVSVGRHEFSGWMSSEMQRQDGGWKDLNQILAKKEEERDARDTGDRSQEAAPAPEEPA